MLVWSLDYQARLSLGVPLDITPCSNICFHMFPISSEQLPAARHSMLIIKCILRRLQAFAGHQGQIFQSSLMFKPILRRKQYPISFMMESFVFANPQSYLPSELALSSLMIWMSKVAFYLHVQVIIQIIQRSGHKKVVQDWKLESLCQMQMKS